MVESLHFSIIDNVEIALQQPVVLGALYLALYLMRDQAKTLNDAVLGLVGRGSDAVSGGLNTTGRNILETSRSDLLGSELAQARARVERLQDQLDIARSEQDGARAERLAARIAAAEVRIEKIEDRVDEPIDTRRLTLLREQLPSSVFSRFAFTLVLSFGLLLVVVFNFMLLADPMTLVVGEGTWRVLGITVERQHFGAAGAIFLEFIIGFFLFEALAITSFFETGARLGRRTRWVLVAALTVALVSLSFVEAWLAISREFFIQLGGDVRGTTAIPHDLALTVNLVIGALMPWFMALSAWPLEILGKDVRYVIVLLFGALLILAALPFALIGFVFRWAASVIWAIYEALFVAVPSKIVSFINSFVKKGG